MTKSKPHKKKCKNCGTTLKGVHVFFNGKKFCNILCLTDYITKEDIKHTIHMKETNQNNKES